MSTLTINPAHAECTSRGIHVSTMTITAKVVGSYIVPKDEYEYVFRDFLPQSSHKSKRFNNQFTICVPVGVDEHRLNIKVFKNGTLQISGAKSMGDIDELAKTLRTRAHMDIGHYKIAMINSNFDVGHRIDLYNLAMFFRETGMHVAYDNQRHPGLHLRYMYNERNVFSNGICSCVVGYNPLTHKYDKRCTRCECHKVSVIIFSTGKIVITGALSINQIVQVHEFLSGVVNRFKIETPAATSTQRNRRRGRINRNPRTNV